LSSLVPIQFGTLDKNMGEQPDALKLVEVLAAISW
jgi:hypothetical protein